MGIAAYHSLNQPGPKQSDCFQQTIENPCAKAECQGMCLLSKDNVGLGVGYRCACPIGQVRSITHSCFYKANCLIITETGGWEELCPCN
jgi:hypothetical protein